MGYTHFNRHVDYPGRRDTQILLPKEHIMNHSKTELYFLLILFAGISAITFFIFKPFLYALILAIVFATVFGPVHKKALILMRERRGPAALLATLSVLVVVVAPLTFLGIQISQEATELYSSLVSDGGAT